jgi:sugar phosphate isomerase/epimerase
MKLSCLPVSLYDALSSGAMSLQEWFAYASALGLDGADISVIHLANLENHYLRGLRGQAADLGLTIPMLVSYSDFTHPSPAERDKQAYELVRHIDAANELGAAYVRVTAGQAHPGVGREIGIRAAVAGLESALDHAQAAGVTLAYENHTRGYGWTRNDFSQPADIFLEIVQRTEGSGLRLLFDTANNLAHGDDPLSLLNAVKHRVSVVHLNDIRRAGHFEPVLLGTGVAPIVELLSGLVGNGYDGWMSVEEASGQGPEVFPTAVRYAEHAWVQAGGKPRGSEASSPINPKIDRGV